MFSCSPDPEFNPCVTTSLTQPRSPGCLGWWTPQYASFTLGRALHAVPGRKLTRPLLVTLPGLAALSLHGSPLPLPVRLVLRLILSG